MPGLDPGIHRKTSGRAKARRSYFGRRVVTIRNQGAEERSASLLSVAPMPSINYEHFIAVRHLNFIMEDTAKLIIAFASLVAAVAWPTTLLVLAILFQKELKLALGRVPTFIDRVKKASLAGVAVELDRVAKAEVEIGADQTGKVTARQLEAATRIAIQTQELEPQALLAQLDRLCLEYDSIRRTLPSGSERTRAMTSVVVRMRALAPSLVDFIDAYKGSGSAGSRLAAVTMMQMVPRTADLEWLLARFESEHPFVFYHSALALENAASVSDTPEKKEHLCKVAQKALRQVRSFNGPPDKGTVEILEILISDLSHR